jgi:precorrin-6A/cobalt-precorrin-6A reductase
VIDATHPFAAEISRHVHEVCLSVGVPLLRLDRPAWPRQAGDRWIEVDDIKAATEAVSRLGKRVWLTLGTSDMAPFASLDGVWFLVRRIAPPPEPLPLPDHRLIYGKGPFSLEAEAALIAEHRIDLLVTKASGGFGTMAKLEAAREAGLPVVMIRRPPVPPGDQVDSVAATLAWLQGLAGLST